MQVHFHHSQLVEAPLETLVEVLTDYLSHPALDPTLVTVTIVRQDADGAELVTERTTRRRRQLHVVDRYDREDDVVIRRSVVGEDGAGTCWWVHRLSTRWSRLTVEAWAELRVDRALVLGPVLRRDFRRFDVIPFPAEAERRAALDAAQP